MRRRLVIEVDDELGYVDIGPQDGTLFSLGGKLRLMERRLVVEFGSDAIKQIVGETLGLQVVTDREQTLCTAIMLLTVASKVSPDVCGQICQMLTEAGFQV